MPVRKMVAWRGSDSNKDGVMTLAYADNVSSLRQRVCKNVVDIRTAIKEKRPPSCLGFSLHPHNGKLRGVYSVAKAWANLSHQQTTMLSRWKKPFTPNWPTKISVG